MEPFTFICAHCGKTHEDWPALAYLSPTNYAVLSEEDKNSIAELSSDFCVITYPDETSKFIRCVLTQKVTDHCEDLDYGLWVSLSDKSFQDYSDNFKNDNYEAQYFGWLSNDLPDYEFDEGIPTTVVLSGGGQRPEIFPHEDFDHPFVRDYYNGITKKEAKRRIRDMIASIRKD